MERNQRQVKMFHEQFGSTIGDTPAIRDPELRASLILEEALETVVAILGTYRAKQVVDQAAASFTRKFVGDDRFDRDTPPDLAEAIDGLCDILYVTYGTAVAFGVDLEPFFDEVHASNMKKASGPRRADGKILKPEGWKPPQIRAMLDALVQR